MLPRGRRSRCTAPLLHLQERRGEGWHRETVGADLWVGGICTRAASPMAWIQDSCSSVFSALKKYVRMPACSAWGDRDCSLLAGISSTQHTVTCREAEKWGERQTGG